MSVRTRTSAAIAVLGATIGATLVATAAPAAAAVGPGEDRQISSPTAWWAYSNITADQVSGFINANGARLTDIRTTGTGAAERFSVTMVANGGAYASGWWWYHDITPSQVVSLATTNHARATVTTCQLVSGATTCSTIMISNTGANAESWSFWVGTAAFTDSKVVAGTRIVSYSRIQGTPNYALVLGSNTGTDALPFWYYRGQTVAQLSALLSQNHARLVDLDRNDDTGTFNAVMYGGAQPGWYWYVGLTPAAMVAKASQQGARLFDITPYSNGRTTVWAGVMVANLSPASQAIFNQLAPAVDSGTWGYAVLPLDGGEAASLQSGTGFEPASSLKVLYHYLSIDRQESGVPNSTAVTYHFDPSNPGNVGICPDSFATTATSTLVNADTQMMQVSDNRMTRGIVELYGKSTMVGEAAALGMTSTQINHNIGCPTATTHNVTTLSDLSKVYAAYDHGTDITTPTWRTLFKKRMLNEDNTGYFSSICPVVQQEASAQGLSTAVANAFCARISWLAKGGSYQYAGSLPAPVSYSQGTLTTLPFRSGTAFVNRGYFYGDFFDNLTLDSSAEGTALSNARTAAYQTAMRPFIAAALATW